MKGSDLGNPRSLWNMSEEELSHGEGKLPIGRRKRLNNSQVAILSLALTIVSCLLTAMSPTASVIRFIFFQPIASFKNPPNSVPLTGAFFHGTASHIPSADDIWIWVVSPGAADNAGFPQHALTVSQAGNFSSSQVTFGSGPCKGKNQWLIEVVEANATADHAMTGFAYNNYYSRGAPSSYGPMPMPIGAQILASTSVYRMKDCLA